MFKQLAQNTKARKVKIQFLSTRGLMPRENHFEEVEEGRKECSKPEQR
jgi:hypothetical protein